MCNAVRVIAPLLENSSKLTKCNRVLKNLKFREILNRYKEVLTVVNGVEKIKEENQNVFKFLFPSLRRGINNGSFGIAPVKF